jgi:hypothetical protein
MEFKMVMTFTPMEIYGINTAHGMPYEKNYN